MRHDHAYVTSLRDHLAKMPSDFLPTTSMAYRHIRRDPRGLSTREPVTCLASLPSLFISML